MYECPPTLVLLEPTYHPVLNHHTGYIFAYFDFHLRKPKELFFQHYYEAVVFAQHIGAKVQLGGALPQRIASEDYLVTLADDSRFINMPDFRQRKHGMYGQAPSSAPLSQSEVSEILDTPTLDIDDVMEIDYFGETV